MKFDSITDCFEWLRMDGSASECVMDCINAHNLGISVLESHFDIWLWLKDDQTEDEAYPTEADKQYARELGRIEELLVKSSLIYKD